MNKSTEEDIILQSSILQIFLMKSGTKYKVGPLFLKCDEQWRCCSNGFDFLINKKPLLFEHYKSTNRPSLILSDISRKFEVEISFSPKISDNLIEINLKAEKKKIKNLKIELSTKFDNKNGPDFVALAGNLYKNIENDECINLKVNQIGAFSGVWTVSSKKTSMSIISTSNTQLKYVGISKNIKNSNLFLEIDVIRNEINKFYVYLGNQDYLEPIKLKLLHIEPITPLNHSINYKAKALKAFYSLKDNFLFQTKNGFIPANFIHYPVTKRDDYQKSPMCSYGNCFSLGYIYGTSAAYLWSKDNAIKESLVNFLNPIIDGAQIKEGPSIGAFYDTYFNTIRKWTTGRVQMDDGGFSDWIPFEPDTENVRSLSGFSLKETINIGKKFLLLKGLVDSIKFLIWTSKFSKMAAPYMKTKISKRVVYPPFTGQFAYFLLQALVDSQNNENFLKVQMEQKIKDSLDSAAEFLLKTQRNNDIWDHELYTDGEIFWGIETLACIFPATFLIWWGKETNNSSMQDKGMKALEKCRALQDTNEYFGMYYETNLYIRQADLVTALACIKCYCKLYEILGNKEYLELARRAAWHVMSFMWSNTYDKKKKEITGGLLVTTYKGLGFPVIGGSELCQCFEVFCELSEHDSQFLIFARALLGYCLHYLIRENKDVLGIYEIIFGYFDDWSSSFSGDFASYATGPFIRGLYLFERLIEKK